MKRLCKKFYDNIGRFGMKQGKNLIIPDVLLVIGNGFDLQCELKSSYYDFLIYVLRNNNGNKETER